MGFLAQLTSVKKQNKTKNKFKFLQLHPFMLAYDVSIDLFFSLFTHYHDPDPRIDMGYPMET